jgi:dihydrofolate synthase/folylpolyglutamate synthase
MTYLECISFLYDSLPMYQRIGAAAYKANLDNTIALMNFLDNPEDKFDSIHVAGTNGKGSVAHNLASIYQQAGYRTGLYTSPHLKDFRERIRIDGEEIPSKYVSDFMKYTMPFFQDFRPSFFEMTVAMAFWYFANQHVDIAIVETGMGGRLDSTNVLSPILSIITNISYDHTQFLGNTLGEIAREKGGIIKPHTPVIIGKTQPETATVFQEIAAEKKAPIYFADQLFEVKEEKTQQYRQEFWMYIHAQSIQDGTYRKFSSPLAGKYQLENFQTILAACQLLGTETLPETAIEEGITNCIKNTHLMGRWQILSENPLCIVDTGHNQAGLECVCKQLEQIPHNNLHFILSVVNDKDLSNILPILPKAARYYFCQADIPRGRNRYELQEIAEQYELYGKAYISIKHALFAAKRAADKNDLIFVGGSTFTVAELL